MDYTAIDTLFSTEIDFFLKYTDYRFIPYSPEVFRSLTVGRKLRRLKQVVLMGAKCAYCPRRCEHIFVGEPKNGPPLAKIMLLSNDLVQLTVDHIFPISKGGDDTSDNRQVLCAKCNFDKADKLGPPRSLRR